MGPKLGKYARYVASLALAGVLLYFSFREVKWADFAQGLSSCRWWPLALSMVAGLCAFILRGLRWRLLLGPLAQGDVARLDTCDAVNIGNVSNMIFPFLGEFVRCGVVARNSRLRYDRVVGTVALERVWDMLSLVLLLVLLLVFRRAQFGAFFAGRIWQPLVSRWSWVAWLFLAALLLVALACVWALVRLHDRNAFLGKVYRGVEGLLQGFGSVLRMRRKGAFMTATALIWVMYWLQIVLLTHAVQSGPDGIVDALFIMLAGSVASFVPVPGGFGAYHYIVALALSSLYGFSWQEGIIFAALSHESQAITMLLSGGFSFMRQSLYRKQA